MPHVDITPEVVHKVLNGLKEGIARKFVYNSCDTVAFNVNRTLKIIIFILFCNEYQVDNDFDNCFTELNRTLLIIFISQLIK